MKGWLWVLSTMFLAAFVVTAIAYPHAMVSPGKLSIAHRSIEQDCFACHEPLFGASADRCVTCHVPGDIGLRSTKGTPLTGGKVRVPFHQALVEGNCMACHSEHARVGSLQRTFAHSLLKPDLRGQCQTCHVAPADAQHRGQIAPCATCHQSTSWKPATFDHAKFFPLEGDHNVACTTCHVGAVYKTYTCYGCHAHERNRMIAEHAEEGIRNIDNCVRCHNGSGLRAHEGREGGEGRDD
jgi:hypothetical protein